MERIAGRIRVFVGDMCRLECHGLVNCANEKGLGGGGLDGAVHAAAGPELLQECYLLQGIPTGTAKLTYGYRLPARWVLHAVGPRGEQPALLVKTYANALNEAKKAGIRSLAIPCISTGIFGYPQHPACKVALTVITAFLKRNPIPEVRRRRTNCSQNYIKHIPGCCSLLQREQRWGRVQKRAQSKTKSALRLLDLVLLLGMQILM